MYKRMLLTLGMSAAVALPSIARAQAEARSFRIEPGGRGFAYSFGEEDSDRAVIGITTSTGSRRDTLGVLVSSVAAGSPAEKAGLEEGNRIASINGVNLKLSPADIDDWDMSSIMSRRLTRELGKLKAGDEVELRVYGNGQVRAIKIKTIAYDSLYRSERRVRYDEDDRAVLGVSLGSSGSKRDTLGVLVTWLNDDGPAAKAGLEEGNRISAINGVDLRVSHDDAGDEMISSVKVQRLQRELAKVKPGDEVELRLYSDGKTRSVKVKTVAASKLNRGRGSIFMDGFPRMMMPTPPIPPMAAPVTAPRVRITRISI
jgi:serine protease Do